MIVLVKILEEIRIQKVYKLKKNFEAYLRGQTWLKEKVLMFICFTLW